MTSPKIIILILITSVLFTPHCARAQDITETTRKYFQEIRLGNYPALPGPLLLPENENATLFLMGNYLSDTVYAVRAKAQEITYLVASNSTSGHIRSQGVSVLLRACSESAPGLIGMALDFLKQFEKDDYSVASKDTLRRLVRDKTSHLEELMKLAGFLGLKDLIPVIRPWTQPGNSTGIRWAAYLSLSRMSESSATAEILERVKKIPVNDDVVYEVFPDLIYTRQAVALNYVIEAMYSTERNCMGADAEKNARIMCGYRIMEQLAPVIADYPLRLDEFGDLQTDDYPGALEQVRQWFLKHKAYTILDHKF